MCRVERIWPCYLVGDNERALHCWALLDFSILLPLSQLLPRPAEIGGSTENIVFESSHFCGSVFEMVPAQPRIRGRFSTGGIDGVRCVSIRARRIAVMVAGGYSNHAMNLLWRSEWTVSACLRRPVAKQDVSSRADLAHHSWACQRASCRD